MTVRDALFGALRERATPVLVFPDHVIPGASLWVVMRLWLDAFRRERLGDSAALAFAPSCNPGAIGAWLAAAWDNLAVALPGHALFPTARARCEPGGMFDVDIDGLAPRETPAGRGEHASVAGGVHGADEYVAWHEVFANARTAECVDIPRASWTTAVRQLGGALLGAEVIRFVPS